MKTILEFLQKKKIVKSDNCNFIDYNKFLCDEIEENGIQPGNICVY